MTNNEKLVIDEMFRMLCVEHEEAGCDNSLIEELGYCPYCEKINFFARVLEIDYVNKH